MGMKKYTVFVIEEYKKTVDVIANSPEEAKKKAHEMWKNAEVLIGDKDFYDVQCRVFTEEDIG